MATLINGNGNTPVTAQQDADFFQGVLGGDFVKMLPVGSQMAYTIEDANTITLADGECVDSEGRRIHIDYGYTDSFTIPTGTSGTTAYYIIGYEISTDSDGNETAGTFVQAMSSATATIDEGSLRDGDSSKYVSLYRVTQTSLTISSVEALFTTIVGFAEALPFGLAIQNSSYGYLDTDGDFHSFRNATGTATAAQVLSGYTFTNASSDNITGTMSNRGNVTVTLNCGNSYTIANGYHGGGGTVTANSLSSQTVGNITAARVLNGYVGWANGTKYTGSMNNWGSNTVTMSSNTATLSAGYYSSISINAASRYTAGYNSATLNHVTIGNFSQTVASTSSSNSTTFNAASVISGYASLTANNFYLTNVIAGAYIITSLTTINANSTSTSGTSISYNSSSGIVNISGLSKTYYVNSSNSAYGIIYEKISSFTLKCVKIG